MLASAADMEAAQKLLTTNKPCVSEMSLHG